MSCNVIRNANSTINTVIAENGQESKLFQKINSELFLGGDSEYSLNIYESILSEDSSNARKDDIGEPQFFFRNESGFVFEDMEDTLLSTESGIFDFGIFNNDEGFIKIGEFNTDSSPVSSFLAQSVKDGTLSTSRNYNRQTGESFIVGKGQFLDTIKTSEYVFAEALANQLGLHADVTESGIRILQTNPYVQVSRSNGIVEVMTKDEAKKTMKDNNVENKVDILLKTSNMLTTPLKDSNNVNIQSLSPLYKNNLLSFLNGMGFSITSLDEYQKSYEVRHGSPVGVEGLVDLSNKIVAIAESADVTSVMTEEVAHIAIEAYSDQESIADALVEVSDTEEYRNNAEKYRNKYSDEYQGVALEEKVRKEILGKVLAKEMLNSKTEAPSNFIQDIWNRFVDFVRSRFYPRKKTALNSIINRIKNDYESQNLDSFNTNFKGDGVFFSLSTNKEIEDALKRSSQKIQGLARASKKTDSQTVLSTGEIRILEGMSSIDSLNNINKVVDTLKRNLESFRARDLNNEMTVVDFDIFNDLYKELFPELERFLKYTSEDSNFKEISVKKVADSVKEDIKDTMNKFSILNSEMNKKDKDLFEGVLDRYIRNNDNLTDEEKNRAIREVTEQRKDISLISKTFTPLSESASGYIRLVARIISDMQTTTDNGFRNFAQNSALMFENNDWRTAQKRVTDKSSYFLEDYYDRQSAENAVKDELSDYISSTLNINKDEVKNTLKNETPVDAIETLARKQNPEISDEQIITYKDGVKKADRKARYNNYTYIFTQEKIENEERLRELANVSDESFEESENYRQQLNSITSKYYVNGKLQLEDMSESDKVARDKVINSRKVRQSPISASGEIMDGLSVLTWEEMTLDQQKYINDLSLKIGGKAFDPINFKKNKFVVLQDGYNIADLSFDARFSLDMNNLSLANMIQRELNPNEYGRNVSNNIKDDINRVLKDVANFPSELGRSLVSTVLNKYGDEQYSSAFYDAMNTNSFNFVESAQQLINSEQNEEKRWKLEQGLEAYKKLSLQKSEILKAYRRSGNSTEVAVENLTEPIRKNIIEIDTQISDIRSMFSIDNDSVSLTERVLSSSFNDMVIESGKSEYRFSLDHMSERRRVDVERFRNYLEASVRTDIVPNKRYEEAIQRIYENNTDTINRITDRSSFTDGSIEINQELESEMDSKLVDLLSTEYAKNNLASYFFGNRLRDSYQTQQDISQALIDGKITVDDLFSENDNISQVSPYMYFSVKPEYAEYNTPERFIDKEYNPIKGSVPRAKFHRPEFLSKYGITEEDYNSVADITELEATINNSDFSLLKFLVQNNKDANELYNTTTNIMLRPQVSKSGYEKIKNAYKVREGVSNLRETVKETFADRVDELMYGDVDYSNVGVKVIPKMHRRRVEDAQQLTDNLFEASMIMMREANLYRNKLQTKKMVDAVRRQAEEREYTKGSISKGVIKIKGEVSQTVKAIQEISDTHIYGIKKDGRMEISFLGKTFDITKFLTQVQSVSSKINLGFSTMIPLTSLTTGVYNNFENNLIGEFFGQSSINRARTSAPADMAKYISSEGRIDAKTKLGALIEMFGLKQAGERFNNSASTRAERILSESMFGLDKVMNVPVLYQSFYATLYDYRYFESPDGNKKGFLSYKGFTAYMKTVDGNISKKDIDNAWKNIEKQSVMDAIEYDNETGHVGFKEEYKNKISENKLDSLVQDISSKVKIIGQQVDGVLSESDKILASRNAILNTLLQHRGFLFINLARAFKGSRYSFATSKVEEGHYTSLGYLLKNMIQDRGNLVKSFNRLEDNQKQNMRRVLIRMMATYLFFLASKAMKYADDDDDTFAEDLSRIILYRTYNEVSDLDPLGMIRTTMGAIKQPVVLYGTLDAAYKAGEEVFDLDKPWSDKDWSKVRKLTMLGKTYDQLRDLDSYTNSWLYYKQYDLPALYNYKPGDD